DLSIANSLWAQNDFKFLQPFLDGLSNNFNAPPELLDFRKAAESARLQINQWVADKTDQKIKNLIAPGALDRESIMVLVNAVYFKADWLSAFKAEDTKELPFHLNSNVSAPVSMMQQQNHFRIFADNQEQVLELPYKGDQLSMVVVLPRKGQDLSALEQKLNMNVLDGWLLNMSEQIVNVKIPKFKFSFGTVELKPFLVDMGMGDAFNRGVADFSGMSKLAPGEHIYIQKVLHKAFVNVDEKGTEAAAATAVIVGAHPCCMVIPIIPKIIHLFNADHPFLFIVRDKKTNSILFIGKVADPRSES
ncbi:MAG: serpin family protein, partial [bacterium]